MSELSVIHNLCEIDFSKAGNSADFIVDGWSGAEDRFTWAIGATSSLELSNVPDDRDIVLEIAVLPYVHASAIPMQRIVIAVNNSFMADVSVGEETVLFCQVPHSFLRKNGRLSLVFGHPDGRSPCEISAGSSDTRVLSFAFERIKVRILGSVTGSIHVQRSFARVKIDTIMYGNCQLGIIAQAFNECPTIRRQTRSHSFENFPDGDGVTVPIPQDLKDSTKLFIHQVGSWGRDSPELRGLNPDAIVVHVPPIGTNALWPLKQAFPKTKTGNDDGLAWTYEYGDKLAIELALSGISRAEYLSRYMATDLSTVTSLVRRHELDMEWISKNETISDIKISDFLEANFSSRRLFWTGGHLTNFIYCELAKRLVRRLSDIGVPPFDSSHDTIVAEVERAFDGLELHAWHQIPVNPQVAAALALDWYDPEYVYRSVGMPAWTFSEYLLAIYDYLNP